MTQPSQVSTSETNLQPKKNVLEIFSNTNSKVNQERKITPQIKNLRKNVQSGAKSSPTRLKLKKDAKLADIRQFFEKKSGASKPPGTKSCENVPVDKGGISTVLAADDQQQPNVQLHLHRQNSPSKLKLAKGGLSRFNSNTCRTSPAGTAQFSSTQDSAIQETGLVELADSTSHISQGQDGDYFLKIIPTDQQHEGVSEAS